MMTAAEPMYSLCRAALCPPISHFPHFRPAALAEPGRNRITAFTGFAYAKCHPHRHRYATHLIGQTKPVKAVEGAAALASPHSREPPSSVVGAAADGSHSGTDRFHKLVRLDGICQISSDDLVGDRTDSLVLPKHPPHEQLFF